MDRDTLKQQIANMTYQAKMERWPLSKSIEA
jgi:guanine nucleotide-binding protein G(I)/G(S)/G(O) subunit gamma-13